MKCLQCGSIDELLVTSGFHFAAVFLILVLIADESLDLNISTSPLPLKWTTFSQSYNLFQIKSVRCVKLERNALQISQNHILLTVEDSKYQMLKIRNLVQKEKRYWFM